MLMTILVSVCIVVVASGETDFQRHRWVTKILYDTLENYVPDGVSTCKRDGQAYQEGLDGLELWATQMYDASAKFPTGILSGKSFDFGDYDECLETETTGLDFKPKYCILNIRFKPSVKLYRNYYNATPPKLSTKSPVWEAVKPNPNPAKVQRNEISTAICIPSSCTHFDLQSTLSPKIISAFNKQEMNVTVHVDSLYCTTQHERPPITLGFIIFWCFILVIVVFIIVGTLSDCYPKEDTESMYKYIFEAFSVPSNLKILFYNSAKTAEFTGIDLLKVISCIVVLYGHRLMYISGQPLYNTNKAEETFEMLEYAVVHNGPLVVDIFFVISGFLTFLGIYNVLLKNKQFNMPLLLLWRWCRLIPLYSVMIAVYAFVLLRLSDGPLWKHIVVQESENCLKNWWTNVLFINNYVNSEQPCMIQSWYLACDLHLYTIGIVIVYFVWKYPKCGKFLTPTAIVVSCFISAYVVYKHQFYPTFFGFISTLRYPPSNKIFTLSYIPTHTRATPYFVGMFAGNIYRNIKSEKPDFRFSYAVLSLCTLFVVCILWMMSIFYFFVHDYSLWMSVAYALTFRLVYSAFVSAFIVICTVNMCFKGTFLPFILAPLSRLTYGAYIGGLSMQLYHVASTRTPTFYNPMLISWISIGDATYGFLIAFILYLMIECPFENLLKKLMKKLSEEKTKNVNRVSDDVEMVSHSTGNHV